MKSLKLIVALSCLAFTTTVFGQKALPTTAVETLDGKKAPITDFINNDKITVLSFWATWCGPCKRELDNFTELTPDWAEEFGDNVDIVAVSIDNARTSPRVGPMVETKGWDFTVLLDKNSELKQALGFQNVPYTFIIKNGQIVYSHDGYKEGDEVELEETIAELLEEK